MLSVFDRLFDRAAQRLSITCTKEEREEARNQFKERFQQALAFADQVNLPELPDTVVSQMEEAIDSLSPAQIAGYLASGSVALKIQEIARRIAMRAAEQRLLQHYLSQIEDPYGGN